MTKLKIVNVVGARPNFMKIAPIYEQMSACSQIEPIIVHTGQHYDKKMSTLFFDQLGLPKPDYYLGVGSAGHGVQTGRVMIEFEEILKELQPDLVLVVGDVNSTIACGLTAVKLGIKLAHVEAGLRSWDRGMPEEINRVLTDQISDFLFLTERTAFANLEREGIDAKRVFFVGNVMIDSLLHHREAAAKQKILATLGLAPRGYALVTLHRPSNVDHVEMLSPLLDVLMEMSARLPIVFPVHPRTRARLTEFGFDERLAACPAIHLVEPLGYLEFLQCMDNATLVLTDSGGIQEETTVLGVPCVTARENTERPITMTEGTNILAGQDPQKIREAVFSILDGKTREGKRPELWDGAAAGRIVKILLEQMC